MHLPAVFASHHHHHPLHLAIPVEINRLGVRVLRERTTGKEKENILIPPTEKPHPMPRGLLGRMGRVVVSTFTAGGTERCFFGSRRQRGQPPGSPYAIQLGFVIGSPGPKDTVHHLTRRNASKMSNQRRVWSPRPPSPGLLPAGGWTPGDPLLSDDLRSRTPVMSRRVYIVARHTARHALAQRAVFPPRLYGSGTKSSRSLGSDIRSKIYLNIEQGEVCILKQGNYNQPEGRRTWPSQPVPEREAEEKGGLSGSYGLQLRTARSFAFSSPSTGRLKWVLMSSVIEGLIRLFGGASVGRRVPNIPRCQAPFASVPDPTALTAFLTMTFALAKLIAETLEQKKREPPDDRTDL
ncbi:hypothetical protein EYF80_020642 [Liparis tanakae]|uniref:Uncharacterized protein n=1 Tax=Liparis tanakae TaxID=230148 RepID=A0A4Z2HV43_9TELE|nr:hypothetical protein EYF80_020642 [Liparis tanakae]